MADLLLYRLADSLRRVAWESLDEGRRPARTFVAPGPRWAHDCHMLVAHWGALNTGDLSGQETFTDPTPPPISWLQTRVPTFVATLVVDCIPEAELLPNKTVRLPEVADLSDAAAYVLGDGWDMYLGIMAARRAGDLWQDETGVPLIGDEGCAGTEIGDPVPFGPSGKTAGVAVPVRVLIP